MQYMSQSFRIKDAEIKDLFLDIAAEELGHMEMVATTINLLNGHDVDATQVQAGEVQTHVLLGLNPGLINSSGYSWTADYVTVTGDLCADLLSNIASEQRAKVVYEYLYRQIDDKKVRETIDFLLNREEAHNQMFRDAFNKVQVTGSNRDFGTTKAAKMYSPCQTPGPTLLQPVKLTLRLSSKYLKNHRQCFGGDFSLYQRQNFVSNDMNRAKCS